MKERAALGRPATLWFGDRRSTVTITGPISTRMWRLMPGVTQLRKPNMAVPTGPNGAQPGNLLVPDDKGMSAADARKRIEEKGYGQVSGLRQDRNFWWEGMAMKNGRQVRVAVDHAGNVTEQR